MGRPKLGKQRAIIVKFCSYQSKIKVMKCKKYLKGISIYINEDLTFYNKELFMPSVSMNDLKLFIILMYNYFITSHTHIIGLSGASPELCLLGGVLNRTL